MKLNELGSRLRLLRKKRGWTLQELAEMVGITKGGLSQIERGEISPSIETLSKIAEAFSISLALLAEPGVDPERLVEISLVLERAKGLSEKNLRLLVSLAESLQDA